MSNGKEVTISQSEIRRQAEIERDRQQRIAQERERFNALQEQSERIKSQLQTRTEKFEAVMAQINQAESSQLNRITSEYEERITHLKSEIVQLEMVRDEQNWKNEKILKRIESIQAIPDTSFDIFNLMETTMQSWGGMSIEDLSAQDGQITMSFVFDSTSNNQGTLQFLMNFDEEKTVFHIETEDVEDNKCEDIMENVKMGLTGSGYDLTYSLDPGRKIGINTPTSLKIPSSKQKTLTQRN